jgi:hypothetical protein
MSYLLSSDLTHSKGKLDVSGSGDDKVLALLEIGL